MLERILSTFDSMDSHHSPNPTQSPSSGPSAPGFHQSHADLIISSLLSFPDSSPIPVTSSFDGVFDKALASIGNESVKDRLVDRTLELASRLLDSTKRCSRKRACAYNSTSWFLPPELTLKVFSKLDAKSLMQAAACCTMFNKCAMDPICYSHIDLISSTQYDDEILGTMIHRAGKELRSLKLGRAAGPVGPNCFRTSCLKSLADNHGYIGSHLRSIRLYNLYAYSDTYSLGDALSVCSNITELHIVRVPNPSEELFKLLTGKCRLLEHLLLEVTYYPCYKMGSSLVEFVISCSNLTSVTLIRFGLTDEMVRSLVENSHKLTFLNLSRSPEMEGRFWRDLAFSCQESPLKTLIIRCCPELQEKEMLAFCNSLLTGNFKSFRYIDVSGNWGFADFRGHCKKPKFPLKRLKEVRPDLTFMCGSYGGSGYEAD